MNKIKEMRVAAGLTQKALAEKSGVNIRIIQKYETGEYGTKNMTVDTAIRICDALGIDDIRDLVK